jgi:hypothetical protein
MKKKIPLNQLNQSKIMKLHFIKNFKDKRLIFIFFNKENI